MVATWKWVPSAGSSAGMRSGHCDRSVDDVAVSAVGWSPGCSLTQVLDSHK